MVAKPVSLDEWRLRRALTYRALGELIGVRVNLAFAYCQKPGTKQFKRPRGDRMAAIFTLTQGEVPPNSFYELPKLAAGDPVTEPQLPLARAAA